MSHPRVAVLVGVLAGIAMPGSALADGGGRPIVLVPDRQPQGGQVTTQAVSPGSSYRCAEAGTLRRKESSYVLGWCPVGMHIDISSGSSSGWQAGWGEGGYQHCGWFETSLHAVVPEGSYDHDCGSTRYNESHFASAINTSPTDGTQVGIRQDCPRYLNVQPWSTVATGPSDYVGTLQTSDRFFWRYRSRNGDWVLGRMERPGTSVFYDWIFVSSGCVNTPTTRAPSTTS